MVNLIRVFNTNKWGTKMVCPNCRAVIRRLSPGIPKCPICKHKPNKAPIWRTQKIKGEPK